MAGSRKQLDTIEELEKKSLCEDDSTAIPPPDIIAYNELRSCADLYRMSRGEEKALNISPDFQRDFVWKDSDQTRFVDSLIKQLPIPSMCFAYDSKEERWLVIDGLQRISTIIRFLDGKNWKLSNLDDIDPNLAGKSVETIKETKTELHKYYKRVENLSIPITVLRCDLTKPTHMEYLFKVFHRLNTGGMKLNNQEIRSCIFEGPFNKLLKELDQYPPWRKINRMKGKQTYRFTKQEIILRFFAFTDGYKTYDGHLARFLNTYMQKHRKAPPEFLEEKRVFFKRTVDCISKFEQDLPKKTIITLLEAMLIGIGKNLELLEQKPRSKISSLYKKLANHPNFSEESLKEGLSKKPRVLARLDSAIEIFSGE